MSSFFKPKRTAVDSFSPSANDFEMSNERASKAARELYSSNVAQDDLRSMYLQVLASAETGNTSQPAAAATPEATAVTQPITAAPVQSTPPAIDPIAEQKQREIYARAKLAIDRAFESFLKTHTDDLAKLQQGPPVPNLANGAVEDPESMKMRLENFELKRALAQRNAVDSERYSQDIKTDYEVYLPKLNQKLLDLGLDPVEHTQQMSEIFVDAARNPSTGGATAIRQLVKASAHVVKEADDKVAKTASENERLFAEQVALKAENARLQALLNAQASKPMPQQQSTSTVPLTKSSPVVASGADKYQRVPAAAWQFVDVRRAAFPQKPLDENVRDGVKDYLETEHLRNTYRFNPITNKPDQF